MDLAKDKVCPKCGHDALVMTHKQKQSRWFRKDIEEHVLIACVMCGYKWKVPPLDSKVESF